MAQSDPYSNTTLAIRKDVTNLNDSLKTITISELFSSQSR